MVSIKLTYSRVEAATACLRPLTGLDESAVRGTGLRAAAALVGRLLAPAPDALEVTDLGAIAMADFDRIIMALHRDLYGEQLDCRSRCADCGESFEFNLPLDHLARAPDNARSITPVSGRPGWFSTADGMIFCLPVLADVLRKVSAADLVAACSPPEGGLLTVVQADAAFAAAAPLACETIETACPHCEADQRIGLDLIDYLTEMLSRERPFLVHETHCIARAYGWGRREIHAMPRDDRRAHVRLIGQEKAVRARAGRRIA